ncbi:unnamed protein product [Ectocarpus sp. 12 AP-2014]
MHTSLAHNTANTPSTRKLLQRYTSLGTSLPSSGWRMDNSAAIGVSELTTTMVFPTLALVLGKQRLKKGQIQSMPTRSETLTRSASPCFDKNKTSGTTTKTNAPDDHDSVSCTPKRQLPKLTKKN